MADFILTQTQVEDTMADAARAILGIPDDNDTVRFAFGGGSSTGSSPKPDFSKKTVCYLTISPTDDGYGKQHHKSYYLPDGADMLTEVDEYTEEYAVIVSCYGNGDANNPFATNQMTAYDMARMLRDGLYSPAAKQILNAQKIYFVVGSPQLIMTRELIDTAWVKRCDFTANFYSYARRERPGTVGYISGVSFQFSE